MANDDLEEGEIADEGLTVPQAGHCDPRKPENGIGGKEAVIDINVPIEKPRKKKKLAKMASAAASTLGCFVDVYGSNAQADVDLSYTHPIRVSAVQALLLWILAEGGNAQWAFVKNKPLISKVTLVAVPGLSADLFNRKQSLLQHLTSLRHKPVTLFAKNATVRPGQVVASLFAVPHTRKRKKYLEALEAGMDGDGADKDAKDKDGSERAGKRRRRPFPPKHYIATMDSLKNFDYPLPTIGPSGEVHVPEGFIATRPGQQDSEAEPPLIGLDCEMCITEAGYELTRISLVNEQGEVILDELVVPNNPITDYNTRYSGITEEMLAPVTTRLADIQQRFLELVPKEALLVGHALHNDLQALKIMHTNIIDTCLQYPHPKGPPFRSALRKLTEMFLKRQIQNGSHDSIDDARAAMELAVLKFKHGPAFGTGAADVQEGDPLCDVLAAAGRRCSLIDRQDVLSRHVTGNAHAFICCDDEECAVSAVKEAKNPATNFLWTQLRALAAFLEQRSWHRRALTLAEAAAGAAADAMKGQVAASGTSRSEADQSAVQQAVDSEEGELSLEAAALPTDFASRKSEQDQESTASVAASLGAKQQRGRLKRKADALNSHPIELPLSDEGLLAEEDPEASNEQEVQEQPPAQLPSSSGAAFRAKGSVSCVADRVSASERSGQIVERPNEDQNGGMNGREDAQPNDGSSGSPAEQLQAVSESPAELLEKEREVAARDACLEDELLRQLDERIGRIYAALPVNALLLVVAGHGDTADVRRLQEQKWRRQQGLDGLPRWNTDSEAQFAKAITNALHGLCFCTVKH